MTNINIIANNFVLLLKIINGFLLFEYILYIYHLIKFKKKQAKILALIDFKSKVNVMTPIYVSKLNLKL